MPLRSHIHQPGIFFVIGSDESQSPVSVVEEDFTGQGHLEPRSYINCYEKRPNPVTVLVDAGSHLGELQNRSARHSEHLPILGRIDDCQMTTLGHPEPCASFPLESVSLSIIPSGKLHSLAIKVWLNIRARINRPVHSVPAYLKRVSFLHLMRAFLKQNVRALFTCRTGQKPEQIFRSVFQYFAHPMCLIINNCNGSGVHNYKLKESDSRNKKVRTRNIGISTYSKYSTASLPVGGL